MPTPEPIRCIVCGASLAGRIGSESEETTEYPRWLVCGEHGDEAGPQPVWRDNGTLDRPLPDLNLELGARVIGVWEQELQIIYMLLDDGLLLLFDANFGGVELWTCPPEDRSFPAPMGVHEATNWDRRPTDPWSYLVRKRPRLLRLRGFRNVDREDVIELDLDGGTVIRLYSHPATWREMGEFAFFIGERWVGERPGG